MIDRRIIEHRPPLGVQRLMGQGRGAALVQPDGVIGWWCPNRFDAPPVLWSLLDVDGGAARWVGAEPATWDPRPAGPTTRTTVRIGSTRVELWDGLVSIGSATVLVRLARSLERATMIEHQLTAGGFDTDWERWDGLGQLSIVGIGAHDGAHDGSTTTTTGSGSRMLCTRFQADPDRWRGFGIRARPVGDDEPEPRWSEEELVEALERADRADSRSLQKVRLPSDHPSRAIDALRVLHALTEPTRGAPVAAPTTSLPEAIGGNRQWDYRYTWLRDSANAVAVAALLGHVRAAESYLGFVDTLLVRYGEHLMPVTTTAGDPVPAERVIDHVGGWAGSRPVRVGNEAGSQRQLDAVTAVIEAIETHLRSGGRRRSSLWRQVDQLAELLCAAPVGKSSGVWEIREPALLVNEEVARWAGLDKALHVKRMLRPWLSRPGWESGREAARARVEAALDPATGMLLQSFDDAEVVPDAASLLVATNGFFARSDPRLARLVRATIAALEEGAFLRRYPAATDDDEMTGREGAFIPASWWAVSALCAIGDLEAAAQRADALCARLPPLQPEQWSVLDGHGLGNVPLLWSHTEAARALYRLHDLRIRRRFGAIGLMAWHLGRSVRLRVRRPL